MSNKVLVAVMGVIAAGLLTVGLLVAGNDDKAELQPPPKSEQVTGTSRPGYDGTYMFFRVDKPVDEEALTGQVRGGTEEVLISFPGGSAQVTSSVADASYGLDYYSSLYAGKKSKLKVAGGEGILIRSKQFGKEQLVAIGAAEGRLYKIQIVTEEPTPVAERILKRITSTLEVVEN